MKPPAVPTFALSRSTRASRPGGALASLLFHGAIILFLAYPATRFLEVRDPGNNPYAESGGGGGGGGGSESVAYISLPALKAPPAVQEPVVLPVETPEVPTSPEPVPVRDTVVQHSELAAADTGHTGTGSPGLLSPGSGGGTGGGQGPGNGPGSGPGSGPGNGGMGTQQPPVLRQFILAPDNVPGDLKGKTITIHFSIRPDGRVEQVEFSPEIRNRDYAKKFRERLLAYIFVPARSAAGNPIAAEYPIEFAF